MRPVNLGDQLQLLNLLPIAAVTATGNGTGVDLEEIDGEIAVMIDVANVAGTLPTMDLTLEDSADNITFGAVTGGAFTQVTTVASAQKISLNSDELKRYLRVVKTIGGTSTPQYLISVKAVGIKQYPA
jgi:hypothetical protein